MVLAIDLKRDLDCVFCLGGTIGDVEDISVMYTQMEQVGGTIGGEEKSGRSVLIPNTQQPRETS